MAQVLLSVRESLTFSSPLAAVCFVRVGVTSQARWAGATVETI